MTIISLLVAIYVVALSVLIGAFYWYGTRPGEEELARENREVKSKL